MADNCKELEQAKNNILEKEEVVLKLEENLAKCQADLAERENKLNDVLQMEVQYNFIILKYNLFYKYSMFNHHNSLNLVQIVG